MIRFLLVSILISTSANAYVPTVESLFRHGSNPDVTLNAASFGMVVKKVGAAEGAQLVEGQGADEVYRVYLHRTNPNFDRLKLTQVKFREKRFVNENLEHKIFYSSFSPQTLNANNENVDKGIFYSVIQSLVFNDGEHVVQYLKNLGVPVRLNNEIINREKIEYLASYKRYLINTNQNKQAKKTEVNPLRPEDSASREKVDSVMKESMYIDTKQVRIAKDGGDMSWFAEAGSFTAVFGYNNRDLKKFSYKSSTGELEILCSDYTVLSGTHRVPRSIQIKTLSGASYQVEITDLRFYNEKEDDLVKRLSDWDMILRGKESSPVQRPEFLL